jgi:DNA-binding XRE family transcriptional regulator
MAYLDTFGKRVKAARVALFEREGRELSQEVLGQLVGVSKGSISAYETGVSEPEKLEIVARLARALGVTGGWLAFGEEPRLRGSGPGDRPGDNGGPSAAGARPQRPKDPTTQTPAIRTKKPRRKQG